MNELITRHCTPCDGSTPPLRQDAIAELQTCVSKWNVVDDRLQLTTAFKNFRAALAFLNAVGEIAEAENHHPDLHLYSWNQVRLELYTHAIGGLSENDFILAAKIEELLGDPVEA